ncbi:hypothetical protein [Selenihalanaerobacter shriftii]|uniref:Uncharacterized protein n=1 Tax=Selenihalanaerobacter shriftii TaxID=142842 RepID=A0A1T4KX69_9FIRM|nr:hypothetical protein [Selenihalanaerobacter shriftii]SJZ46943.1 hypothetical protein SAMN02745118_00922 [Selenihalanaerobacter shriftii]
MKRAISSFVILTLLLSLMSFNLWAGEIQPTFSIKKLNVVEEKIYGHQTAKPLLIRIKDLEKELYGRKMSGSLIERANRITNVVLTNQPHRPSLLFTLSAVEWSLQQQVSQGPIKERLAKLEKLLLGEEQSGSISSRIGKLLNYSLPQGKIKVKEIDIPSHTLVKIELLEKLNSSQVRKGEKIPYRVVNDILVDGKLVLPAGSRGKVTVTGVEEAKSFGQDGKIKLDFNKIALMDGTKVGLNIAKKAMEENRSMKMAVGASILGTAILGPAGLVTGYFVKGDDKVIKANQPFYVETQFPVVVFGIPIEPSMKDEADMKGNVSKSDESNMKDKAKK